MAVAKVGLFGALHMVEEIFADQKALAEEVNRAGYFPSMVIVGRKNPAKQRKVKKKKTRDQNNWSVATFYAKSLGDYTSMRNNLKHKGYPLLLDKVEADPWEIPHENEYRVRYRFYKSFDEYMVLKGKVNDPKWIEIADKLNKEKPAVATGQTRLF